MNDNGKLALVGITLLGVAAHKQYPGGLGRLLADVVEAQAKRDAQPEALSHSGAVLVGRECLKCSKVMWGARCYACDPYTASPSIFRRGQLKNKSRRPAKARKLLTGREPLPEPAPKLPEAAPVAVVSESQKKAESAKAPRRLKKHANQYSD